MTGFVLALISSIFFSLYVVPRKFTRLDPIYFSLLVGIGFFVGSVILYLVLLATGYREIIHAEILWSVLGGVLWAFGLVSLVMSIDSLGLTRSNQWKNLQGPVGVILTLLILSEYMQVNAGWAIFAGLCVFLSAIFINVPRQGETRAQNLRGIWFAILSSLAFGSVTVINKYVVTEVGVYSQLVLWSFSIAATLFLYSILYKNLGEIKAISRKDILLGFGAGLIYLGASLFMLESYRFVPASIGFTIIQLNAIWTFLIGIFIFNEIEALRHYVRLTAGIVLAFIGILMLLFAVV